MYSKLLKYYYFTMLKVKNQYTFCIKYQIVLYCVWNNITSQKNFKTRALALDDGIYASLEIFFDFFMSITEKR